MFIRYKKTRVRSKVRRESANGSHPSFHAIVVLVFGFEFEQISTLMSHILDIILRSIVKEAFD
jgi:hypothetical protein